MLRRPALLLTAMLLAACGASEAPAPADKTVRLKERLARARAAAEQPPRVTRHRLEQGELLVMETTLASPRGFAEIQRCFVWRDTEYRTTAMQCPGDSDVVPLEGPPPDPGYRP